MLTLVEHLQDQGLDVRYDQVVLNVGDSLIQKLSLEIANGDFLVAIVSPDSVESGWCQRELAMAATQGINQQRVKVLPIKFRSPAAMPPVLEDTMWADADVYPVETVARKLVAAIRAHLEGRDEDAPRDAIRAEAGPGQPAHGETAGDVGVAQLDEVAQRTWDVFKAWEAVWAGQGNMNDVEDPQRRLRWACDVLPTRVRAALPLVEQLATAQWVFFEQADIPETEGQIREELRSVRTRVAQGLPVVSRWVIINELGEVNAGDRDATAYGWEIERGAEGRRIIVLVSGTAMSWDGEGLPPEVVAAVQTRGRSVLTTLLGLDDPPTEVMVTTAGLSFPEPSAPSDPRN